MRKYLFSIVILLCISVFLFTYLMPLKFLPFILPKAGSLNVRVEGYLQKIHVGVYVLWDKNCQNTTIAYIPDGVKSKNGALFQKIDGGPLSERLIAHGVFDGKIQRDSSIKEKGGDRGQVYIEVKDMKIQKVAKISDQFKSTSQCSMMY
ncbi:hypothetical protein [Asticcacaulis benevestitus]|uniref:Uncharacterized protein n=1 Tax=Asticcacaulis benevestitus DSM 16100 = ATCC BAA-896 TaxID=1121022 RepID=V4QIW7_9CAUL|nr:hypothetical protein [Asticcacaulis benevestitus]ESQ79108.1 hypothetical protein ABENE_22935 [Asticcacaulis benevestitus DSM 16100 = ATCC BAA-896]